MLVTIVVVLAVAIAVWRSLVARRGRELPPDWQAVAIVLAGDGVPALRDGDPTRVRFSDPFGLAAAPDGGIYVSDAGDSQRIRRITPTGVVVTVAGSERGRADGYAWTARFDTPSGIAVARDGSIYVADTGNNAVRRVAPDGIVSTVAGSGAPGYRDGPAGEALFNGPLGIAIDGAGRLVVADTYNDRIRLLSSDRMVRTIAGGAQSGLIDGGAADARFDTPSGVAVDAAGRIYVADTGNNVVRAIDSDGVVTTLGPVPDDGLVRPVGIAVSDAGVVYVTDDRGRIVEITPGIRARTLSGSQPGFADGAARDARFRSLAGLALLGQGRLAVGDARNALIRIVAAPSRLDPRAPPRPTIRPVFDAAAFAATPLLWPIAPMEGPFEITGTLGESRGGEGSERLHAGIDIHAPQGTFVTVVRRGVITQPLSTGGFGTLNEFMRIGPIAYVHFRAGRGQRDEPFDTDRFVPTYDDRGRMVQIRAKRGARFEVGQPIGTVNAFNHIHLNVGWPSEEHNPLAFTLMNFRDTVRPTIARGGIRLFAPDGRPITARTRGRIVVQGPVRIVVDAWDQVNGNARRRRLGLYRLGYQVLGRDGRPAPGFEAPRETIRFDRFAPDESARIVYAAGSGIRVYGSPRTRFLYVVTNRLRQGVASEDFWDTSLLPPGDYVLRIVASDARGNEAIRNRDLPVTVVPGQS